MMIDRADWAFECQSDLGAPMYRRLVLAGAVAAILTSASLSAARDARGRPAPPPSRYGYVLEFKAKALPKGVTIREVRDAQGTRHFIKNTGAAPLVINQRFQNKRLISGAKLVSGKVYQYFPNGVPMQGKRHLKGWQAPFGEIKETLIRLAKDPPKIYAGRKPGLSKVLPRSEPVELPASYDGKPFKIKATIHYHLNKAYDVHQAKHDAKRKKKP